MNKNIIIGVVVGAVIVLGIAAFSMMGGSSTKSYDSNFYLPPVVNDFDGDGGDTPINFQSDMTLDEVLSFYREKYSDLTERELLTVQTETTLNLVFDGHESGNALVVQAVKLPDGSTNINIRLEEI